MSNQKVKDAIRAYNDKRGQADPLRDAVSKLTAFQSKSLKDIKKLSITQKRYNDICSSFGVKSFRIIDEDIQSLEADRDLATEEDASRTASRPNKNDKLSLPIRSWQDQFRFANPISVRDSSSKPIAIKYKSAKVIEEEYKTSIVKSSNLDFNKSSLLWHIVKYLSRCKGPAHINKIIDAMDDKNLLHTKHHKYSKISNILNTNFLIFIKTEKATFTIRKGFKKTKSQSTIVLPQENLNHITTLSDIVITLSKECEKKDTRVYPGLILQLLKERGYACTYSSVYKIMQSNSFVRDGYDYKVI